MILFVICVIAMHLLRHWIVVVSHFYFFRGLSVSDLAFIFIGALMFKPGPFIRPHPFFWSLILSMSLLYLLAIIFLLFQVNFIYYILYYIILYILYCILYILLYCIVFILIAFISIVLYIVFTSLRTSMMLDNSWEWSIQLLERCLMKNLTQQTVPWQLKI